MSIVDQLAARLSEGTLRNGSSRRSFLSVVTLGGAALATHPWRFVTKPQSAYATCTQSGTDNSCGAGYTVFCCTVNQGRNMCPPGTFAGGWWKADRSSYCGGAARYIIDCNALPGHPQPCSCNSTGCDHRLHACNIFRYGQCNTQIPGTTAVVCRQVTCTPPWKVYPGACSATSQTDNNTAEHSAPCLNHALFPAGRRVLIAGQTLHEGESLVSRNRRYRAVLQGNGALVLQDGLRDTLWSTSPHPQATVRLSLTPSGELVLRGPHAVVWRSHTTGRGAQQCWVTDGGNLVLGTDRNVVLWKAKR
jgi:hypothetical protein